MCVSCSGWPLLSALFLLCLSNNPNKFTFRHVEWKQPIMSRTHSAGHLDVSSSPYLQRTLAFTQILIFTLCLYNYSFCGFGDLLWLCKTYTYYVQHPHAPLKTYLLHKRCFSVRKHNRVSDEEWLDDHIKYINNTHTHTHTHTYIYIY